MSISTVSSHQALSYLQSLLQPQTGASSEGVSDPLASLFSAFTGTGTGSSNSASSGTTTSSSSSVLGASSMFSPDTLSAMLSMQDPTTSATDGSSSLQSLFSKFDANGDGSISQSEFENAIGPNADKSQVDALFQKLDANGDGSISTDELAAAEKKALSHAHHHHHMQGMGGGDNGDGDGPNGSGDASGLPSFLTGSDAAGATTQTTSNSDGSSTTTITYSDGTTMTLTTPATASSSSSNDNSSSNNSQTGTTAAGFNLLEQLFKMQSQILAQQSASSTLAIS